MTELAATLGCVYEDCCDDDSSEDDVPYYAWWIRVPAAEHARRAKDGIPFAVDQLHRYLATQLPADLKWEITPDRERTADHAGSSTMRDAYEDLILPIERALIPLRQDGADRLVPRAKVWKWEDNLLVGTFDLWLCDDPDRPHTWLVVTAGLWTEPQLFDEEPAAAVGHFEFTPHHPLLFLPRPPAPVTFTARAETGEFPSTGKPRAKGTEAIGTTHQVSATPEALRWEHGHAPCCEEASMAPKSRSNCTRRSVGTAVPGCRSGPVMRKFGVGHPTVQNPLESAWPKPRKKLPSRPTCLDPYKAVIDQMLRADLDAPRKQRHTAKRVFDRLLEEHQAYAISYAMVRDYVAVRRGEIRAAAGRGPVEAFVPQSHRSRYSVGSGCCR